MVCLPKSMLDLYGKVVGIYGKGTYSSPTSGMGLFLLNILPALECRRSLFREWRMPYWTHLRTCSNNETPGAGGAHQSRTFNDGNTILWL